LSRASVHTAGIVLQSRDYREADRVVTFFGEITGKLSGIAFGAKRSRIRFANCLDICSKSRFFLILKADRELSRLDRCELIQAYPSLREHAAAWAYAAYMGDLVNRLTAPGDVNPGVYHLLDAAFNRLNEEEPPSEVARVFELRLLGLLGYRLELTQCLSCGKPPPEGIECGFSPGRGGIVCPGCAISLHHSLSPGTLRALRFAQAAPLETLTRLRLTPRNLREAKDSLHATLARLLHKPLPSMAYIQRMEKEGRP